MHIKRLKLDACIKVADKVVGVCVAEIAMPDGVQYKKPFYFMRVTNESGEVVIDPQTMFVESSETAKQLVAKRSAEALGYKLEDVTFTAEWQVIDLF